MTIFRERDRRAEDRKRRSRGVGRGETQVEIRPPSIGRGGEMVVSMMMWGGANIEGHWGVEGGQNGRPQVRLNQVKNEKKLRSALMRGGGVLERCTAFKDVRPIESKNKTSSVKGESREDRRWEREKGKEEDKNQSRGQ